MGAAFMFSERDKLLEPLAHQVRQDVEVFNYYSRPWVKPRSRIDGSKVYDVFIAGAGQNGLGTYFGLQLNGIHNVAIVDKNPKDQEGNFYSYRRMNTLRTPKELVGMDFGIPNLTFRRYCETLFGTTWWEELKNVPRAEWVAYLQWFKDVLEIPVRNERDLMRIEDDGDGTFILHVRCPQGMETYYARSVVLATGPSGEMQKSYPSEFVVNAPTTVWSHAADPIDFDMLKGKRMAILGHGAGAFDVAGCALERGLGEVHLCYRRKTIPKVNPHRHIEYAGMMAGFRELPEAMRWKINVNMAQRDQPPPQLAYDRVASYENFHLYSEAQWKTVEYENDELHISLGEKTLVVDYAVLATGFSRKPMDRPEIAAFADDILTWEDYQAPEGYESKSYQNHPHTGKHFEYLPKTPGQSECVRKIFNLSFGSCLNMGPHLTSISGLNFSLKLVVEGIRNILLVEDADHYMEQFFKFEQCELDTHQHPGC